FLIKHSRKSLQIALFGLFCRPGARFQCHLSRLSSLLPPSLLPMQLRFERSLTLDDISLVSRRVDERVFITGLPSRILLIEAKVAAVRTQEDVARQAAQHLESVLVVGRNPRISTVADEF